MIKITNPNFQNRTIENIDVDGESINNLEIKLTKTKFNIVIVKEDGKSIKKEMKKKNSPEVVDLVMDELEEEETMKIEEEIVEVVEPVVNEIQEEPILKIKEEIVEEVIDVVQEVEEEIKGEITEVVEPVMITLGKMKDLLKQHIPKKNTLDTYCRTIQQVYHHFKIEDMNELLKNKRTRHHRLH